MSTVPAIASREEVLELLTLAARRGDVRAAGILLAELRIDFASAATGSVIDQLAERRARPPVRVH